MKKQINIYLVTQIISAVLAFNGLGTLLFDGFIKPIFDNKYELKLTWIIVSILLAYHTLLMFVIRLAVQNEINNVKEDIGNVSSKIAILNESVPYSELDKIEYEHGHLNRKTKCEIWIISNTLQEAQRDDVMLDVIYENLSKNNINYFYILPDTENSKMEIQSLQSRLSEIHMKHSGKISGSLNYRFDGNLLNTISSDYFDIVLFIDVDKNGVPHVVGNEVKCEGFQCFSNISKNNKYFYQRISDQNRIVNIRSFQLKKPFKKLKIG